MEIDSLSIFELIGTAVEQIGPVKDPAVGRRGIIREIELVRKRVRVEWHRGPDGKSIVSFKGWIEARYVKQINVNAL